MDELWSGAALRTERHGNAVMALAGGTRPVDRREVLETR
jgi:hypothetical protein